MSPTPKSDTSLVAPIQQKLIHKKVVTSTLVENPSVNLPFTNPAGQSCETVTSLKKVSKTRQPKKSAASSSAQSLEQPIPIPPAVIRPTPISASPTPPHYEPIKQRQKRKPTTTEEASVTTALALNGTHAQLAQGVPMKPASKVVEPRKPNSSQTQPVTDGIPIQIGPPSFRLIVSPPLEHEEPPRKKLKKLVPPKSPARSKLVSTSAISAPSMVNLLPPSKPTEVDWSRFDTSISSLSPTEIFAMYGSGTQKSKETNPPVHTAPKTSSRKKKSTSKIGVPSASALPVPDASENLVSQAAVPSVMLSNMAYVPNQGNLQQSQDSPADPSNHPPPVVQVPNEKQVQNTNSGVKKPIKKIPKLKKLPISDLPPSQQPSIETRILEPNSSRPSSGTQVFPPSIQQQPQAESVNMDVNPQPLSNPALILPSKEPPTRKLKRQLPSVVEPQAQLQPTSDQAGPHVAVPVILLETQPTKKVAWKKLKSTNHQDSSLPPSILPTSVLPAVTAPEPTPVFIPQMVPPSSVPDAQVQKAARVAKKPKSVPAHAGKLPSDQSAHVITLSPAADSQPTTEIPPSQVANLSQPSNSAAVLVPGASKPVKQKSKVANTQPMVEPASTLAPVPSLTPITINSTDTLAVSQPIPTLDHPRAKKKKSNSPSPVSSFELPSESVAPPPLTDDVALISKAPPKGKKAAKHPLTSSTTLPVIQQPNVDPPQTGLPPLPAQASDSASINRFIAQDSTDQQAAPPIMPNKLSRKPKNLKSAQPTQPPPDLPIPTQEDLPASATQNSTVSKPSGRSKRPKQPKPPVQQSESTTVSDAAQQPIMQVTTPDSCPPSNTAQQASLSVSDQPVVASQPVSARHNRTISTPAPNPIKPLPKPKNQKVTKRVVESVTNKSSLPAQLDTQSKDSKPAPIKNSKQIKKRKRLNKQSERRESPASSQLNASRAQTKKHKRAATWKPSHPTPTKKIAPNETIPAPTKTAHRIRQKRRRQSQINRVLSEAGSSRAPSESEYNSNIKGFDTQLNASSTNQAGVQNNGARQKVVLAQNNVEPRASVQVPVRYGEWKISLAADTVVPHATLQRMWKMLNEALRLGLAIPVESNVTATLTSPSPCAEAPKIIETQDPPMPKLVAPTPLNAVNSSTGSVQSMANVQSLVPSASGATTRIIEESRPEEVLPITTNSPNAPQDNTIRPIETFTSTCKDPPPPNSVVPDANEGLEAQIRRLSGRLLPKPDLLRQLDSEAEDDQSDNQRSEQDEEEEEEEKEKKTDRYRSKPPTTTYVDSSEEEDDRSSDDQVPNPALPEVSNTSSAFAILMPQDEVTQGSPEPTVLTQIKSVPFADSSPRHANYETSAGPTTADEINDIASDYTSSQDSGQQTAVMMALELERTEGLTSLREPPKRIGSGRQLRSATAAAASSSPSTISSKVWFDMLIWVDVSEFEGLKSSTDPFFFRFFYTPARQSSPSKSLDEIKKPHTRSAEATALAQEVTANPTVTTSQPVAFENANVQKKTLNVSLRDKDPSSDSNSPLNETTADDLSISSSEGFPSLHAPPNNHLTPVSHVNNSQSEEEIDQMALTPVPSIAAAVNDQDSTQQIVEPPVMTTNPPSSVSSPEESAAKTIDKPLKSIRESNKFSSSSDSNSDSDSIDKPPPSTQRVKALQKMSGNNHVQVSSSQPLIRTKTISIGLRDSNRSKRRKTLDAFTPDDFELLNHHHHSQPVTKLVSSDSSSSSSESDTDEDEELLNSGLPKSKLVGINKLKKGKKRQSMIEMWTKEEARNKKKLK
ncbi:hypothetical protein CROQUDRAFT_133024 [Cronartium quercuum f. sp. fusiforme G11]|uniref:Uncharacterized protein n=1 Tax=Cronartium quercuum f. sp. fusiforme G11 TaxID=708437 RepID=A0A9P6NII5_9BASI|nr:hypothetical protein CROQUDRAFT_133024 [Cronartium quercuum f. sp. fusiforme G11]